MTTKTVNPYLTRQSDISDINPQRVSRETVIGNYWDQTSQTSRIPENTRNAQSQTAHRTPERGTSMNKRDRPTDAEFKTFWSVFEAKQQAKRHGHQTRLELPTASATDNPSKETP